MTTNNYKKRLVVFLLSPRLIDFDTYIPIAFDLKRKRPDWKIRFVTFSEDNYKSILSNATLVQALSECGDLYYLGGGTAGWALRRFRQIISVMRLIGWILTYPGAVFFNGRQYSNFFYGLLYGVNRLFGGCGFILARSRQFDDGVHLHIRARFEVSDPKPSIVRRLFGKDSDGLIYYHDYQDNYLGSLEKHGALLDTPRLVLGMPNELKSWKAFIANVAEQELKAIEGASQGSNQIYSFYAPKMASARNLRTPESVNFAFDLVLETLFEAKPDAIVLVRPHPIDPNPEYLVKSMEKYGAHRVRPTFIHPEVMAALASRCFLIAPTNIVFTITNGWFIDCTDYRQEHFDELGEEALGKGFSLTYIRPTRADFKAAFQAALGEEDWISHPERFKNRNLLNSGEPDLAPLLNWIETRANYPAAEQRS